MSGRLKILLSKILERIEVDRDKETTIKMLDKYHSRPKAHVLVLPIW